MRPDGQISRSVDTADQPADVQVQPAGAGKTTTVECIEGLRKADEGEISVLGLDPLRALAEITQRVGVQLQHSELPAGLSPW